MGWWGGRFVPLAAVVFGLVLTVGFAPLDLANGGAKKTATATLHLPADFPVGLRAPVLGKLDGDVPDETQFLLKTTQGRKPTVAAQRERGTDNVWFLWEANRGEPGSTLEFEVLPLENSPLARIAERSEGFQFLEGDRPVLFYQQQPKSREGKYTRAGYVHPLLGLDGEMLSEDFSDDHPHHRGVFWAWHQLWVGDRKIGDPWVTEDHLAVVREARVVAEGPVFAELAVEVDWVSPLFTDASGQPKPIVRENTTIRMFRSAGGAQAIDFEIALRALVRNVRIGGSENDRGYSGFTVRVQPPEGMVLNDAIGTLTEDRIQQASPWADASGYFGEGRESGVSILSHPSLPEFPPKWVLRHYGMQNVAYPGRHAVPLSEDKPLVLRHRVLVHRGDMKAARTVAQQRVYEMTGKPMAE